MSTMDTSAWTVKCAQCDKVRPWAERHLDHGCPFPPVKLENALDVFWAANQRRDGVTK